jgi:hypothetical protein
MTMTNNVGDAPCALFARGPALLTEDELAAVAGGIVIFPKSPPFGSGGREHEPVAPPGGYTP